MEVLRELSEILKNSEKFIFFTNFLEIPRNCLDKFRKVLEMSSGKCPENDWAGQTIDYRHPDNA